MSINEKGKNFDKMKEERYELTSTTNTGQKLDKKKT